MKKRTGYRNINVDGNEYTYAVSLGASCVVVYDSKDEKSVLSFDNFPDKPSNKFHPTVGFRGKHDGGVWGKPRVAELIRHCLHK
jgi:hypothetical protein